MVVGMKRIVAVEALSGYRLKLRYDDGVAGEISLIHLLDKPVFQPLRDPSLFSQVKVRRGRALEWPGEVDLCADALYLEITGEKPETLFPGLRTGAFHA
jgi:hypothetical protein